MSEEKNIGGRPRRGQSVRINVTRKFSPELIAALETTTTNQSEFIEGWMWAHPFLQDKQPPRESHQCSECDNDAVLECKIGSYKPSTWWCSLCYIKKHIADEEE